MSVCETKESMTYSVEGTEGCLATRGEAERGMREKGHAWEEDGARAAVFNMCGSLTARLDAGRAVFAVSHTVSSIRDSSVYRTFPSLIPPIISIGPQISTREKKSNMDTQT